MKALRLLGIPLFYLLLCFIAISCGDDDPTSDTPVKPFLYIDYSKYMPIKISGEEQTVPVEVFTNIDTHNIELDYFDATWVSLNDILEGEKNQWFYIFKVEANETTGRRTASIAFRADGVETATAAILQSSIEDQ